MPKIVMSSLEIDVWEKELRKNEVINLNFSGQFSNPIAFNAAAGTMGQYQADKDYAIISVVTSISTEAETTPLGGICLLTFQNAHNHFPIQPNPAGGNFSGGLVQGDVIFSMAFLTDSQQLSSINPRNSYLEKGRFIFAHCHNPTATGKTTMMMQVSILPVYKQ